MKPEQQEANQELAYQLTRRDAKLDLLCGEIIGCLRINRERGTIISENDAEFDALIESWAKRRMEI
jgi:hypothetical protein